MYRTERNYENLNKGIFPGAGRFDIPILRPELTTAKNWISFNYAKGCEEPSEHGVHFFVDDYQFNRIWAHPDNYLGMMARFDTVCTPRFQHIYRFPPHNSNLQPLPQALAGCLLAGPRHQGHSDHLMEYAG